MKINIRTVTLGISNKNLFDLNLQNDIHKFFLNAINHFSSVGISATTKRINLPLINSDDKFNFQRTNEIIKTLDKICKEEGIRWFGIPFSTFGKADPRLLQQQILEIIKRYPNTFINLIIAKDKKINFQGISQGSRLINEISRLSSSGYDNFRFGVSCNIKPNTPFFPFTYQEGESGFSIGLELVNEMIQIVQNTQTGDLNIIKDDIINKITPCIQEIDRVAKTIEKNTGFEYKGIDVSLAPLPRPGNSVAELIEILGSESFGSHGTLFITSYLTNILKAIIKKGNIRSVGFNGVMFSQSEDAGMGKRNSNRMYGIDSLISYSSVCGCGIDMVPIPGNSFEEEISALIIDVAGLSCTWDKPLGIRLLPIPMKNENEYTDFNHDFLYNTRIQGLGNQSLKQGYFKDQILDYKY